MIKSKLTKRVAFGCAIYSVVVVSVYLLCSFILKAWLRYLIIPILGFLFLGVYLIVVRPFSKKRIGNGRKIFRYFLSTVLCAAFTVGIFFAIDYYSPFLYPMILSRREVPHRSLQIIYEADGTYVITNESNTDFKILQLTDIHLGGKYATLSLDEAAFYSVYTVIERARPDLIIITGDLVYPIPIQSFTTDNATPFYQLCEFMNRIGIPWTFVYGNHETELIATHTAEQLNNILRGYSYAEGKGCLLYADVQPGIYGRSNQLIEIHNADGSLNQALFLLDSNDYATSTLNDYDCIHPNQVTWYRDSIEKLSAREEKTISSMLFFHIPLPEYRAAYEALQSGSADAEYLFGENREGISYSDYDSGLFDTVLDLDSTKAIFVGHDHLNDLGVKYKGVDLIYGKSIDYLAYPGIDKQNEQRGGTLIKVQPDSDYEVFQVSDRWDYNEPYYVP